MNMTTIRRAALVLLPFALSASVAFGGRLSGRVVDAQGAELDSVTLRFVAEDGGGRSVPPVAVKKGKFAVASFPRGAYHVEIEGDSWVVRRVELELRDEQGSVVGQLATDVAPGVLPPTFEVAPSQRGRMTLTLGPREAGTASAVSVSVAAAASAELSGLNRLLEQGDMEGLRKGAEKVLAEHPDSGAAHYLHGVALWRTGDTEGAVPELEKAAELAPEQEGIQGVLGQVLLDEGGRLSGLGREAEARETFGRAAAAFAKQLERSPGERTWLHNQVIALDRGGFRDEAIDALRKLVAADPTHRQAHLRLGELLTDAGRADEAIAALEATPEPGEDVVVALYNAAVPLFNAGETARVIAAMRKAIEIAPQVPFPHAMLGRALLVDGDKAGALEEFREFLRLAPDDPEAEQLRRLVQALEAGS